MCDRLLYTAGPGQPDFEFLLETKVSPSIGLLGLVNIDLSGIYNNQFALHVLNTADNGVIVQVQPVSKQSEDTKEVTRYIRLTCAGSKVIWTL